MPDLSRLDASLSDFCHGRGHDAWRTLGAHLASEDGREGCRFVVWAPKASEVRLVGDFGGWHPQPMQRQHDFWHLFVPGVQAGQAYKFQVVQADGHVQDKADPFARQAEADWPFASRVVGEPGHRWRDGAWMKERGGRQHRGAPVSIYELHLASWRWRDGRPMSYREVAGPLVEHVQRLGFTHVEFLPLAEHPYAPSWGYQVTGYFAPTSRHGTPDDLRYLVDELHGAGIGVLVDWVPAHFPRDGHGLARFDGTAQFEYQDWRAEHPDWGTLIFDYGRPEVRSFLLASAHCWLDQFHVDGLRVDAVASMLYLDYSRGPGQWHPDPVHGNLNIQAVELLRQLNDMVHEHFPGALTAAEESTAFPGVTRPTSEGGLGFSYKWNMGWMHDTLHYFHLDPFFRAEPAHHDRLTFPTMYAYSEAYVLPLSHDEVVHGKGTLLRKMGRPGNLGDDLDDAVRRGALAPEQAAQERHFRWVAEGIRQLRLLYGYQWLFPGKKLLFMGQEIAQEREWSQDRELDWHLAEAPDRVGLQAWLGELNRLYRSHPALHEGDADPAGFRWVDGSDYASSILVFSRLGGGREVVIVAHFTPAWRGSQWVPMPATGRYRALTSSDLVVFGGQTQSVPEVVEAREQWGRPRVQLDLPGYSLLVLERLREGEG